MHKIDSDGATVDFKFTEGNISMSVPATIVSAAWLNAVQGELVEVIEALGFTLNTSSGDTEDQLYAALLELAKRGGRPAPITQTLANNTTADVVDFPEFDTADVLALKFFYRAVRRTDTTDYTQAGYFYATWDNENSSWRVSRQSFHDDDLGLEFSVLLVSGTNYELQYTTDNLAGASYTGSLQITEVVMVMA